MSVTKFDDLTIRRLFGSEDAESENASRLKEYFVRSGAYENLMADLPLRIVVGHKGTGKSALLRRAYLDDVENGVVAVEIQPNDIAELMISPAGETFIQRIERWKIGIKRIVAEKALAVLVDDMAEKVQYEKLAKIGKNITEFVRSSFSDIKPVIADSIKQRFVEKFLSNGLVRVYIDDVDRGWSASREDISNISALLNAARDLCRSDQALQCRIALRTDVYFLVRTSDESTDKTEQDVIVLQWTNDEILRLISLRVMTFLHIPHLNDLSGLSQARISREILGHVMEPVYAGKGIWEQVPVSIPLMSLCRKRPRDLVKLLHASARIAAKNGHTSISNTDLTLAFEQYSQERLQDLVNEFRSELPEIENILLKFRPTKAERRTDIRFLYSTDQIITKIRNIKQQVSVAFTSRKLASEAALLTFLYKIDFLIARNENGLKPTWTYFDQQRFLANEYADFGYKWEIHPAYRWALQPDDIQGVIDSLCSTGNVVAS